MTVSSFQSSSTLLDGKGLAAKIRQGLQAHIQMLQTQVERSPGLAVVMVGDDPASEVYVRNKNKACEKVGIISFGQHLPADTPQADLSRVIQRLNADDRVDGILIQLPLPQHLDAISLLHQIAPTKDVDGLHAMNLGRLVRGEVGLRSCTPAGIMRLLQEYDITMTGKRAIVLGRSILVGKPLALMLVDANATVTMAHSKTLDLACLTREADLVFSAVGSPGLITTEMIKPGAVVVDIGINRVTDEAGQARLTGDVDFLPVAEKASFITPVPGGVGPMTVAMLLHNTVWRYCKHFKQPLP